MKKHRLVQTLGMQILEAHAERDEEGLGMVIAAGGVSHMVQLLCEGNRMQDTLQEMGKIIAARALGSCMSNNNVHWGSVVAEIKAAGGVGQMVKMLFDENLDAKSSAARALGYMCNGPLHLDTVVADLTAVGGMQQLVQLFFDGDEAVERSAALALANICKSTVHLGSVVAELKSAGRLPQLFGADVIDALPEKCIPPVVATYFDSLAQDKEEDESSEHFD